MAKRKTPQLVTVDAAKLSFGLKTTFKGMVLVFESIGVPDLDEFLDTIPEAEETEKAEKTEEATDTEAKPEKAEEPIEEAPAEEVPVEEAPAEEVSTEAAGEEAAVEEPAQTQPAEDKGGASDISLDDITKIIVKKLKANRKNNEAIGQLLKTYGVAKVSDLPAEKYEAFLTDISQI